VQNRHGGEDRKTSHLLHFRSLGQEHEGPALYRGGAERVSPILRGAHALLSLEALWKGTEEGREVLSGHFAAVCVELGKVSWKEPEELATSEEKWWHILKFGELYNDRERLPGPLAEEEGVEMVMDKVKQVNRSPRMRALMEAHEKMRRDNENFLDDAIVEAEERRNREIAKALKLEKVDAAAIARATGMSVAEIEAL